MRHWSLAIALLPLTASAQHSVPAAAGVSAPDGSYDWSRVQQGKLENGMRYAVLSRRGRDPGFGIFLRVEGGFLAERRPEERGLVHLIEHVFFVSPTTGARDDLGHVQRVGGPLTLAAPTAGSTSYGNSSYFLSARDNAPATVDGLVGLFREAVSDLTFRADAVDGQRAEVMREMAGKALGNAIYASYVRDVAPGSPNDWIEGQNSDAVPSASVETIRALYRRLYRPERTTIVIVGDVDPGQVAGVIRKHFGDWKGVGAVPASRPDPRMEPDRVAPISHAGLAGGRSVLTIGVTMPVSPTPADRARRMEAVLMDVAAGEAATARLQAALPNSPPGKLGAAIENAEGFRIVRLHDFVRPGEWQAEVGTLADAACGLATRGFSESEWSAGRQRAIAALGQRSTAMTAARNVDLAAELGNAVADGTEPIAPDALLAHARRWLPTVTAAAASRWWRREWQAAAAHIRVEAPELAGVADADAAIRAALGGAEGLAEYCRAAPAER